MNAKTSSLGVGPVEVAVRVFDVAVQGDVRDVDQLAHVPRLPDRTAAERFGGRFRSLARGYDEAAGLQAANGIVGQAANRSLDDPAVAIVYHQAESFDTLRAFLANDDLEAKMQAAGSCPRADVQFFTGGWAEQYH